MFGKTNVSGGLLKNNVKSVQTYRGYLNYAESNITIAAVVPERCICIVESAISGSMLSSICKLMVKAEITSTSNLKISRGVSGDSLYVSIKIIEFENVKTAIKGLVTNVSTSEASITIPTVNQTKTIVLFSFNTASNEFGKAYSMFYDRFANSETVRIAPMNNPTVANFSYNIIEFN